LAEQARSESILRNPSPTDEHDDDDTSQASPAAFDDDEEGVFLDPDVYARSRDLLGADGSLRLFDAGGRRGSTTSSSRPTTEYGYDDTKEGRRRNVMNDYLASFISPATIASPEEKGDDASMSDLLEALRKNQPTSSSSSTTTITTTTTTSNANAEELHRRVLAKEEGFLRQSELFRESLTDASKSLDAAEFRTGEAFRLRQQVAMTSLDQQMTEWLATLATQQPVLHPCPQCGCDLTPAELAHAAAHASHSTDASARICRVCLSEQIARDTRAATRTSTFSTGVSPPWQASYHPKGRRPPTAAAGRRSEYAGQRSARPSRIDNTSRIRKLLSDPSDHTEARSELPSRIDSTPKLRKLLSDPSDPSEARSELPSPLAAPEKEAEEWEEIEDPDTGEIFYWNANTDEMKWEK
jgi:hypothetical protein